MRMMGWFIAGLSTKRKRSRPRSKPGCQARRDDALDRAQLQRQRRDNREARSVMSVNRMTKQEKTFY